jgi:hypothetical protein
MGFGNNLGKLYYVLHPNCTLKDEAELTNGQDPRKKLSRK